MPRCIFVTPDAIRGFRWVSIVTEREMMKLDRLSFATGLVGLGILGLIYGDFALQWQPVPSWIPGRTALAHVAALITVATSVGILVPRFAMLSARVLFGYTLLWVVLLKLPRIVITPLVEATWMGAAEIVVIACAAWALMSRRDQRGIRISQLVFGAALIPLGISHFVYANTTIGFVPSWLPFRPAWAYLGGAGHVAAGFGVLFGVVPRLAATMEAAMIGVFTALVWGPAIIAAPTNRLQWTGFIISWIIAAGAWVVAGTLPKREALTAIEPAGDSSRVFPAGSIVPKRRAATAAHR